MRGGVDGVMEDVTVEEGILVDVVTAADGTGLA